ncbi:MAG: protein translocase subunit SecF, partial [Candidatus Omnitrophota bacterium]
LILILGFMGLFHSTLTLPGIAGIILTLGMAVDANVLINERMREERKLGKSLRASVAAGYHKALSAIVDSNLTTVAAAALLFWFGTGPIKGFAITLTVGLLASMFTSIIVTRVIFDLLLNADMLHSLPMLNVFPETKIDFIGKRKICYIISIIMVIVSFALFAKNGQKNFGVDFAGGTVIQYAFKKDINIDTVRKALSELGLGEASIQQFKDKPREISIKIKENKTTAIETKLKAALPDNQFDILRVETVGPTAGKELKGKAFWCLLLGLVAIAIYIAVRFNLKYGIAGIIALIYDVCIAIGALALTHRQFDLTIVAALLTIAGYSINDTVVVYDRIRENLKINRKGSLADVINSSVNQMLSRTVLTTGVTLLVVIALFFFGGQVLNDFSFALLIGFSSGVYSSVYIAGPLLIAWEKKRLAAPAKK